MNQSCLYADDSLLAHILIDDVEVAIEVEARLLLMQPAASVAGIEQVKGLF